jgi:hypothetical protein
MCTHDPEEDKVISGSIHKYNAWITHFHRDIRNLVPNGSCPPDRPVVRGAAEHHPLPSSPHPLYVLCVLDFLSLGSRALALVLCTYTCGYTSVYTCTRPNDAAGRDFTRELQPSQPLGPRLESDPSPACPCV